MQRLLIMPFPDQILDQVRGVNLCGPLVTADSKAEFALALIALQNRLFDLDRLIIAPPQEQIE